MEKNEKIKLEYYDGDVEKQKALRCLWDEAFKDPKDFADYYFNYVCTGNKILTAYIGDTLVGMLHLNPYNVSIFGRVEVCYYIVGVAVKTDMRRKGIMRSMMNRAIADMTLWRCPFAFLMPEKKEYYKSFGFETIYRTRKLIYEFEKNRDDYMVLPDIPSYELVLSSKNLKILAADINKKLEMQQCGVFSIRDEKYLHSMIREHLCQNGGVRVIADDRMHGIFSYDIYDSVLYAERVEIFDMRVQDVLRCIVSFADEKNCSKCIITLSEKVLLDVNTAIGGLAPYEEEDKGIMALPLVKNSEVSTEKLREKSFFDEII